MSDVDPADLVPSTKDRQRRIGAESSLTERDEHPHEVGDDPWWSESWYFDLVTPDGSLGAYARLGLVPRRGVAWWWAAVVRPGQPTIIVRDHEVPLPRQGLEIRTEGLWAELLCDEAFERWSIGMEAFGVALEHPADAYRGERGDRTAVGFDLEWESTADPYRYPGLDRYEIPCEVHGELLLGDERITVDAHGERDHSWGRRSWWELGWWWTTFHPPGRTLHGMTLDAPGIEFDAGFEATAGAEDLTERDLSFAAADVLDGDGLLVRSEMAYGDERFVVEPIAHAPLLLEDGEGHKTRFARSLCRWTGDDGQVGYGWYERNQPQG